MPNDYASNEVICPFYRYSRGNAVYCEGPLEDSRLIYRFSDVISRQIYMDENCCRYTYKDTCPLARAILEEKG